MNAPRHHAGYTLVELLVGLAIAAIILLPLADLLRSSADSAHLVRTRLNLQADVGFALDRIADKAARTGVTVDAAAGNRADQVEIETANWLKELGFCAYHDPAKPTPPELFEAASCASYPGSGVIASNLARIELTSPAIDGAVPVLRIALTLNNADIGAMSVVTRTRSVRLGAYP